MHDDSPLVRISVDGRGVATVTLDRPGRHNALSNAMVGELDAALQALGDDERVRVVVLAADGASFCAGADIAEMRAAADAPPEANEREAARLAALLQRLDTLPRPTVARVQGNAFGGALGLIAACDVAMAVEEARFAFSEVRLGLVPAMISPYVLRAIGARHARRYFLTGERFTAEVAARIGLVHEVVPADGLTAAVAGITDELLLGAPGAQAEAKRLVRHVTGRDASADERLTAETIAWIARLRAAAEGREGLSAFLGKRAAGWRRT